jgi:uncharacterized sulfatase
MFQTPTTRGWKKLYDQGKLRPPMTSFWETKPVEELYNLANDPDEVRNLALSPVHRAVLDRLRKAQRDLAIRIRDVGFLPEDEIHRRGQGLTPYEMGHDDHRYPMETIMAAAELASSLEKNAEAELAQMLRNGDSAVRYWGAMGILMRGADAVNAARPTLRKALADSSPSVRVVAAHALAQYANDEDVTKSLDVLLELARLDQNGIYVSMLALNALDELDDKAKDASDAIKNLPKDDPAVHPRMKDYIPDLIDKTLADLKGYAD